LVGFGGVGLEVGVGFGFEAFEVLVEVGGEEEELGVFELEAADGFGDAALAEEEGLSAEGHERCLEVNCLPVYMAERKLGIAFVRDVTEQWLARKQAERQNFDLEIKVLQRTAALRQAERRLIAAINSASEGFAAFDWTGKLLFANEQIWAAAPISLWCTEDMSLPVFLRCFSMCEGGTSGSSTPGRPSRNLNMICW